MKKITYFMCIFFIAASFLLPQSIDVSQIKFKLRVTVARANIRSGPSTQNDVITQVRLGTTLDAVEKEGNWYRVLLPGEKDKPAYIHQSIIEVLEEIKIEKTPPKIEPEAPIQKPVTPPPIIQQQPKPSDIRRKQELTPGQKQKYKKIYIKAAYNAGFSESSVSSSWTETIYHETANTSLSYNFQKSDSIRASLGYLFTRSLAIEIGADVNITPRNAIGSYTATIPHPLLYDTNRQTQDSKTYEVTENAVFLNLAFVSRFNKFGIDMFAGPVYIQAKATVISDMNVVESYPYNSVTLDITTTDVSKNVFGFNGGASLQFNFMENLAVYIQGVYLYGSTTFETGTEIPGPEINLGGIKAGAGIKILF